MQLSVRLGWVVVVSSMACEPGGVMVQSPWPPDASPSGSGTTAGPDGGALDGGGLDDGGLDDGGSPGDGASEGDGGGSLSTLVPSESTWRVSASAPPGWTQPDFDDTAWESRRAPLGAGYEVAGAWPSRGGPTYLRHGFEAPLEDDDVLELRVRRDDGAIAYLDGIEVGRWNVATGTAGPGASVIDEVEGADGYTYFVSVPAPVVGPGPHVLAVEVHQRGDADLVFDARLRRIEPDHPIDVVMIQVRTRSYGGSYAPSNVGAIWVEDSNGAFVRSLVVWGNARREHLVAWFASSHDDRVDAVTSATASSHHSRFVEWDRRDARGALVPDGDYVARFELTESNSNQGAAAGPTLSVPFSTAAACSTQTGGSPSLDDIVVVSPCP